jgi:hypothetical protein
VVSTYIVAQMFNGQWRFYAGPNDDATHKWTNDPASAFSFLSRMEAQRIAKDVSGFVRTK